MKKQWARYGWTAFCLAWLILILVGLGWLPFRTGTAIPRMFPDAAILLSGVSIVLAFGARLRYSANVYFLSFFLQWIIVFATGHWWIARRTELSLVKQVVVPLLIMVFFVVTMALNYGVGYE